MILCAIYHFVILNLMIFLPHGSGTIAHKHVYDPHGRDVLNTIYGYNKPLCIPDFMRKHLGATIIESPYRKVWCFTIYIVSHTSWRLYNGANTSHYVSFDMIPEPGLINLSYNTIATATAISFQIMYK
jgi:hypothetical protein